MPLKKLLETTCGLLSGTALFAIMALTFFDVGGRKLLNQSIPGSLELTELLMVVVIFGALPLVSQRGEHVVFDSLDSYLPATVRRFQRLFVDALIGVALLGLGYLMLKTGQQFAINGDNTAQLKIDKAPFLYGMGVLSAITGFVHFGLIFSPASESVVIDAEHSGTAL
jgi:TRAP-type C4-dicarboxylate transport system permease small subunit